MIHLCLKQPRNRRCSFDRDQGHDRSHLWRVDLIWRSEAVVLSSRPLYPLPPFPMADKAATNKPVKTFRLRGVTASVFENKSEDNKSSFFKDSLQRSYKHGDEWKSTSSFGRDDLPIVSLLTKQAWEFMLTSESNGAKDEPVE